ncbi:MAG: DUF1054 family protein [Leptospirillia bacterium]
MKKIADWLTPTMVKIFEIPGFAERMGEIRGTVRPALLELAKCLSEEMEKKGVTLFPHVASHMRRRVNPPNETWLALGPEKRGYKAYGHLGLFVGRGGCSVRFVVKDEATTPRQRLGRFLAEDPEAREWISRETEVRDFGVVHGSGEVGPIYAPNLPEAGDRLARLKSASLDIGWPVGFDMPIRGVVEKMERLLPLYRTANGS